MASLKVVAGTFPNNIAFKFEGSALSITTASANFRGLNLLTGAQTLTRAFKNLVELAPETCSLSVACVFAYCSRSRKVTCIDSVAAIHVIIGAPLCDR
mmetsp:Transcript_20144/g.49412  ORF Transcript_20144/g.49412 Transcript_20144/m.49412 type:complete len:98 (-) Transcript_20144:59-352(-)